MNLHPALAEATGMGHNGKLYYYFINMQEETSRPEEGIEKVNIDDYPYQMIAYLEAVKDPDIVICFFDKVPENDEEKAKFGSQLADKVWRTIFATRLTVATTTSVPEIKKSYEDILKVVKKIKEKIK